MYYLVSSIYLKNVAEETTTGSAYELVLDLIWLSGPLQAVHIVKAESYSVKHYKIQI